MKNILNIFKNDIKKIIKNMIVFIVVIGIAIVPALYSWFNIAANHDPYSNTSDIPFAVCCLDKGYSYKNIPINAGDDIIGNLKQNKSMGWDFVDSKEALDGVKNGKYYAAVIIPEDFSENLLSVITGEFNQANLKYYVNEKKNAIAPKITNTGVQTIQNEIASTYVETITKTLATILNVTGEIVSGDKTAVTNKIIDTLDDLKIQMNTFDDSIDVFVSTTENIENLVQNNKEMLPDINRTLSKSGIIASDVKSSIESAKKTSKDTVNTVDGMINSLETTYNSINSQINYIFNGTSGGAADELINIANSLDNSTAIQNISDFLLNLQNSGIKIDNAINSLQNFTSHQTALNDKIKTAADTVKSAGSLPKETLNEIKELVALCENDIKELQVSFENIKKTISDMIDSVIASQQSIDKQITELSNQIGTDLNAAADRLSNITNLNKKIIDSNNSIIAVLQYMQTIFQIDNSNLIKSLQDINTNQQNIINEINSAADTLRKTGNLPQNTLKEIKSLIQTCNNEYNSIVNSLANINISVSDIFNKIIKTQTDIDSKLTSAADMLDGNTEKAANDLMDLINVNNKLVSVNNTVISFLKNANSELSSEKEVALQNLNNINSNINKFSEKLKSAADNVKNTGNIPASLKSETDNLKNTIKSQIASLKNAFAPFKNSLNKSIDDMYEVLENASGLFNTVNGDVPNIEKTLDSASDSLYQIKNTFKNIKKLAGDYKEKIDNLQKKIHELADSGTIENFVSTIIEKPDALGNFVAKPVKLETNEIYHVENYGSAMTPFYSTLGFWVGGIVLVAVVRTNITKREYKRLNNPTSTQVFFGRFITFFLLSQIQSIIIALGDLLFLKVQCENIPLFILTSMISGFVYVLIIYSLTVTFSVLGKALSVIILVIQVAGSGGTFPIEVLPATFKTLAPYLPFKYSIDMMREAICGVDSQAYITNLLCLLAFVPVALIIGLLLRRPLIKVISFFNERIDESQLIT